MTTDSFPLRLDTSTGVIKFIETDSDDLLVIAAKVGEYIAAKYDSSSRGRFELKTGTGDAGYIGTIVDTDWENSTNGTAVDSTGIEVINNHYLGLIETGNVNQKTDAVDAQMLALLGMVIKTPIWTPPPAIYYELQQRLAYRDDLVAMRLQEQNRLHALMHQPTIIASVQQRLEAHIQLLTEQIWTWSEKSKACSIHPKPGQRQLHNVSSG